jgi:hypothetical protein
MKNVSIYVKVSGQNRDHWRSLVNMVMNFRFLETAENVETSWATVILSRSNLLHWVT